MAYSSAAWSNRVPLPRPRAGAATQRWVTCSQPPHRLPRRPPNHSPRPLFKKKPTGYQLSWPVAAILYEERDSLTNRLSESLGSGSNTTFSSSISDSCRGVVEDADEVACLTRRGIGDLVAAAGAVGDDQRLGRCGSHFRQDVELTDLQRHLVMLGFVAEGSRHTAAGRLEGLDSEAWDQLQCLHRGAGCRKGFLVTMPMM